MSIRVNGREKSLSATSCEPSIVEWVPLPSWLAVVMGFVLLDLVIYWQHVFAHRIDWFWKLHRTHHADTDYDLTTGLRFHPLEIIISMLIKALAIFVLGVPVLGAIPAAGEKAAGQARAKEPSS